MTAHTDHRRGHALDTALHTYMAQPTNFGPDGHPEHLAELDAFTAGWDAHAASTTLDPAIVRRVLHWHYGLDDDDLGNLSDLLDDLQAAVTTAGNPT